MKKLVHGLALSALCVSLAACNNEKARNLIDQRADESVAGLREAKAPAPPKSFNPLVVSDRVYAGTNAIRMRRGLPLPARYEGPKGVILVSADPLPLGEIAAIISSQTGIPVRIAPGTTSGGASASASSGASAGQGNSAGANNPSSAFLNPINPGSTGVGPGGTGATASTTGSSSGGPVAPSSSTMLLAHEGPLSNVLDQIAGYFGINWRYDGTSILFSRVETRIFTIEAMPGKLSTKDDVAGNSSGGGGSSGGGSSGSSGGSGGGGGASNALTQTASVSSDFDSWDDIQKTIQSIIGGVQGSSMVAAPSNGTIAVTTTPEAMRVVADYVKQENRRLSRQVGINVEVYRIDMQDVTDFSVKWRNALNSLKNFGFNFQTGAGPTAGTDPVTFGDVALGFAGGAINNSNAIGSPANFGVAILDGDITGMFSALSGLSDASRVAQFPLVTLNNRPVSRRVGRRVGYLESSQSDTLASSGSAGATTSSTLEAAYVDDGFSLQLTPRVFDDGRVLLHYSMSLTGLVRDDIRRVTVGNSAIELPETTNRVFVQQTLLKSGSTLVIGGIDDEITSQKSSGVGDPYNYLLGGGSSTNKQRSMLFVAITPQILDVPRAEQN